MKSIARIRILRDGVERTIDVGAGRAVIGSAAGPQIHVRVVGEDVAPEHAVLVLDGDWSLEAVGGPLAVDGTAVARGGHARIAHGSRIALAGWTLVIDEPPPDSDAAGPMRTASLARELVRDLLGGELEVGPTLLIDAGPGAGRILTLAPPPSRVVIGRGEESDVVVLDADLSRRHLAFDRDGDGIRVVDLGSKNGTRLGNNAVTEEGCELRAGDVVTAGRTRIRLQDPAEEYLRALDRRTPSVTTATLPPRVAPPAPPRASLAPVVIAAAIAIAAVVALILLLV